MPTQNTPIELSKKRARTYRLVASRRTKACARPSPVLHRRLSPSAIIFCVRATTCSGCYSTHT